MSYVDTITALSPIAWFRLGESAGTAIVDETGTLSDGTYVGAFTLGQAGGTGDSDTAVGFNLAGEDSAHGYTPPNSQLSNLPACTINLFLLTSDLEYRGVFVWGDAIAGNIVSIRTMNTGGIEFTIDGGAQATERTSETIDAGTTMRMVTCRFTASTAMDIFVDGVKVNSTTVVGSVPATTPTAAANEYTFATNYRSLGSNYLEGTIDDVSVYTSALTDQQILDIFTAANGGAGPSIPQAALPSKFDGFVLSAQSILSSRFTTNTQTAQSTLPSFFEAADPAHYTAEAARWSAEVVLDNVDRTLDLTTTVEVEHAETASGLATFTLIPPPGPIDLGDYERKPVTITFVGRDADGVELYRSRRFTGITSRAVFDPDEGTLEVRATTDLQGRVENLPRESIDQIVGGLWSEHVFQDDADGWQYAQDRLSTRASEIHVDNYGALRVVPWAAGTPAVEFTDSSRFGGTLGLQRAARRDLLTRVRVNMDFRFTRLRHREIVVNFVFNNGLCGWLAGEAQLPAKSVIQSSADSNIWTRTSEVKFDELPTEPLTGICGGTNFVPTDDSSQFCLGANWNAARRWGQTITEEYALDVYAPDLEEAIGQQLTNLDYGVEAVYDATDYENNTAFTGPPTTAVLSPKTGDWQEDATDAERTGRLAMEEATEVALEVAKTLMLERARRNVVTFSPVYDPSVTLEQTARVNTPYLKATGKIARLAETLDLLSGEPAMSVELAVSRHGGSGLAIDDPIVSPSEPEQPQEEITARKYTIGTRSGGTTNAVADNPDWDGWVTNAYSVARTDPNNLYRERFVLRMPEIEEAARQATVQPTSDDYEVEIPQDELTLSN